MIYGVASQRNVTKGQTLCHTTHDITSVPVVTFCCGRVRSLHFGRDDKESGLIGSLEPRDGSAGQQLRAPAEPSRGSANDAGLNLKL